MLSVVNHLINRKTFNNYVKKTDGKEICEEGPFGSICTLSELREDPEM